MNLIAIQATSPQMTTLTPNLPPIPTHTTKMPSGPPRRHRPRPRRIIRKRRLRQQLLHNPIRRHRRRIRAQQRIIIIFRLNKLRLSRRLLIPIRFHIHSLSLPRRCRRPSNRTRHSRRPLNACRTSRCRAAPHSSSSSLAPLCRDDVRASRALHACHAAAAGCYCCFLVVEVVPEGLLGLENAADVRGGFCSCAACAGFAGLFHGCGDGDVALVLPIEFGDVAGDCVGLS